MSAAPIPHLGSFLASPSSDFAPNPGLSPSLQSRRRASPPAAAPARRATSSPPLPIHAVAGEARLHPLCAVLAPPASFWPRLAAPARAAAAVAARVRAHAAPRRVVAAPTRGSRRVPCLDPAGGPLARGSRLSVSGPAQPGVPSDLARIFLGLVEQQACKIRINSCIAPKIMKLVLLDFSS